MKLAFALAITGSNPYIRMMWCICIINSILSITTSHSSQVWTFHHLATLWQSTRLDKYTLTPALWYSAMSTNGHHISNGTDSSNGIAPKSTAPFPEWYLTNWPFSTSSNSIHQPPLSLGSPCSDHPPRPQTPVRRSHYPSWPPSRALVPWGKPARSRPQLENLQWHTRRWDRHRVRHRQHLHCGYVSRLELLASV